MIKGDYDKLDDLAKFNVCSQHHTPLVVAWHGGEKSWVLRCGENHYPDAITRQPSLTGLYKQGEELPSYIEENIKKRERRKAMTQGNKAVSPEYALLPTKDLGSDRELTLDEVEALVSYAHKYSLDPFRGHVVLMYGKPYITIDGYLYHANQSGKPYTLASRPMTFSELDQYKVGATDYAWLAELTFTNTGGKFIGTGIVTYDEMTATSERHPDQLRSPVVAKYPWQLAQKRAEWQALRRAFPIGETKEVKYETGDKG